MLDFGIENHGFLSYSQVMEPHIVFEDEQIIAAFKPKGLPTAPLRGIEGESLLSWVISKYPEIASVHGLSDWEPGLLHRLDTPTSGLVLLARTQKAFDQLAYLQDRSLMIKSYEAEVSGFGPDETYPELPEALESALKDGFPARPFAIESYFRPFGVGRKEVRPCTRDHRNASRHYYRTELRLEDSGKVLCMIKKGFRHQIRCHLAWLGHPIKGDGTYGPSEGELQLECVKISFPSLSDENGITTISIEK
jgi:23S rRNA pseudouridine1911/1915/1917 synthase